jgi:glycosyltransferase involved in cell wall biosynthesis
MKHEYRLAVVISHPIQYFSPMFRDLAREESMALKVFYCCDWGCRDYHDPGFDKAISWDIPLLEGYEHEFLPISRRPEKMTFSTVDNPTVTERLAAFSPDAVWIHGYAYRTNWRVWLWERGRVKKIFFGDSELLSERSLPTKLIKRLTLPRFFRGLDAFVTIGENNEKYYRAYGVPGKKMFRGAYPVDVQRFQGGPEGLPAGSREGVRSRFGLDKESVVVIFLGKLTAIKRPLDLVEALAGLRDVHPSLQALFVGSGPLLPQVEERVRARGLEERVRMAGFVNQSDLPKILSSGDILAMPSEKEPYGIAVTEAAAAGNAIIASDMVGCVGPSDVARPGVNTLVYRCGNITELAECLKTLAEDKPLRQEMQSESRSLAWTQDKSVTVQAALRAMKSLS